MSDELVATITNLLAVLLGLEIVAALAAFAYIVRVYRSTPEPRPILFRMIVRDDNGKVIAGLWLGGLVVWRLWVIPPGVPFPSWTAPISALAIAILLWPIIDHALTLHRIRTENRERRRS